ncbi:metallophosphoesterase [Myroides sp. LJL119]
MNYFCLIPSKGYKTFLLLCFITLFTFNSCATYKTQYGSEQRKEISHIDMENDTLSHSYFFSSNIGLASSQKQRESLDILKDYLLKQDHQNSTMVFLGNNIPVMHEIDSDLLDQDKFLTQSLDLANQTHGNTLFLKGENEWRLGYEGANTFSKFLRDYTGNKKAVLPRNNCALERFKINDQTVVLAIDSQWYLENWDVNPNINEDCDIKTREDFFEALRGEINKNQNKVVILAMHHPIFNHGNHGGYFSFRNHIFPFSNKIPLPVIGSVFNYTRAMSGIDSQDLQSKKYNELSQMIQTMGKMYDNVIVVSGHEHNMQYIDKDNIKQVNIGGFAADSPSRVIGLNDFSASELGFVRIDITKNRKAYIGYYAIKDHQVTPLFMKEILDLSLQDNFEVNPVEFQLVKASVYPKQWTKKSSFYRYLWGEHYRELYAKDILVPSVDLSQLKNGLTPSISGGGNQSMSLRLQDSSGKEYVMRGVRKSASRFVQTALFKDTYVMDRFTDTWAEKFIYDFYTTAHPFTPLIIGELSQRIGLYHTNPELYYIPKQPRLGRFNKQYGDQLYIIEERPSKGYEDLDSFGNAKNIISTQDVISNLRKDEKYKVDQIAFVRARIFDMLIGDWDRHADQWRWSEFVQGDSILYKPIARDRDQAFAKIDGALLSLIKKLPALRHMQSYTKEFASPRWINRTAFPLDQYLLKDLTLKNWLIQAEDIAKSLDDKTIDEAFSKLPIQVQDQEIENIKEVFKARRDGILDYLPSYYNRLRSYVILSGTDKKDIFHLTRLDNGSVHVKQYRDKKSGQVLEFENIYDPSITKEIWIYALNDQDEFIVDGNSKDSKIMLRLIGGKNKDTYDIVTSNKVRVYDYNRTNNVLIDNHNKVKSYFSDSYDLNNFNYKNVPITALQVLPQVGYNPEDGAKIGFGINLTKDRFIRDPYSSKHILKANYSFNTQGIEVRYNGIFPRATSNWSFTLDAKATSPNFAVNYYGMGNETYYFDNEKGKDYKRVRIESYGISPGYYYQDKLGSNFGINIGYETKKVMYKTGRYITSGPDVVNADVFSMQPYASLVSSYEYKQYNYKASPTLGFGFKADLGWKLNLKSTNTNFLFLDASVNFIHYLDKLQRLVFATNIAYQNRFNNNFEFYDAATLGGNANLRGFRPERFTGRSSFVQTSDLRYSVTSFSAGFIPMQFGVYAGFDYGRVWVDSQDSRKWHNAYGAGIWVNAIDQATLQCSLFNSKDGARFVFGLGFGF